MKKLMGIVILFILVIGIFIFVSFFDNSSSFTSKVVNYHGNNLRISIDGATVNTLPTNGMYYLTSYQCDSTFTKVSWDYNNYELIVSNGIQRGGISCDLTFESSPKLSDMMIGSYVDYTGISGVVGNTSVSCKINGSSSSSLATDETEAPNSCQGQNAREDLDHSEFTHGYCYNSDYRYYTSGWRIAYIDNTDANAPRAILISAGAPECMSRSTTVANDTYIQIANTRALKYCNSGLVDGGCSCEDQDGNGLCDSASSDAWGFSDTDFYYMTKAISGVGKRLTDNSSSLGDIGGSLGNTLYCVNQYAHQECGYHNDLIDNGGYYWFGGIYDNNLKDGVFWNPYGRVVSNDTSVFSYGMRPLIRLSSSVYIVGGNGTMEDPYRISNR